MLYVEFAIYCRVRREGEMQATVRCAALNGCVSRWNCTRSCLFQVRVGTGWRCVDCGWRRAARNPRPRRYEGGTKISRFLAQDLRPLKCSPLGCQASGSSRSTRDNPDLRLDQPVLWSELSAVSQHTFERHNVSGIVRRTSASSLQLGIFSCRKRVGGYRVVSRNRCCAPTSVGKMGDAGSF